MKITISELTNGEMESMIDEIKEESQNESEES